MNYLLKTYGCQMNKSDSERIAAVLESAGYKRADNESVADLIVLNICSVRQSAIDRIFGNVKKYNKLKKKNPNLKTVITGCVLEKDRKKFEKLFDAVVGIKEIEKLAGKLTLLPLLGKTFNISASPTHISLPSSGGKPTSPLNKGGWGVESVEKHNRRDYFNIIPRHQSKTTAYVPIMTGCNNFCAYCVVPYTRGREYSRSSMEIIKEIDKLVKKGYKEIILLGQNVNSYKSQIPGLSPRDIGDSKFQINSKFKNPDSKFQIPDSNNITFPHLLQLIDAVPGNFWIHFLTSHPKDMTEELIKTVSECKKCAEYIHLALQSGDDEILKKMNRKYTAEHFLDLVKMIRKHIPNAAISTDVIVGFPGETKEQFQNTAKVMKKARFDMAYINKYSPRAGTAAAKLADDVSWKEKKRREKILTEILKETTLENSRKYIGKVIEVLIENTDNNFIYGKTGTFKNVKIEIGNCKFVSVLNPNQESETEKDKQYGNTYYHTKSLVGEFIKAKITKAGMWGLEGEIIKN